jgi:hypothetical protein
MGRRRRAPKPKKVSYELIPRDGLFGGPMYGLLDELVEEHHEDLQHAKIALAWCTSWKPDVDGRVTLGKCRKASDLDKEITQFDFVILLSRWFWRLDTTTAMQRRALLDHELSHARPKMGPDGEQAEDERGRLVWRIRKHDLEEFIDVVKRNGCYLRDIEQFAAAAIRAPLPAFEPCATCVEGSAGAGWIQFLDGRGASRVKRCECWLAWQERCADLIAGKAQAGGDDHEPEPEHDHDEDVPSVLEQVN